MNIKLDENLKSYMQTHGHKDIVVYIKHGSGCCSGSFLMAKARFAKASDEKLTEDGYVAVETELGRVYYDPQKVVPEGKVEFLMERFFGKVVVQVLGMRAADERFDRAVNMQCNLQKKE